MVNCNSDLSHKSTDAVLEDGKQSPRYALLLPLSAVLEFMGFSPNAVKYCFISEGQL